MKWLRNMKRYKIVKCPKCGRLGSTEANLSYKCVLCNKSSRMMKKDSKLGTVANVVVIDSFDNPLMCSQVLTAHKSKLIRENVQKRF